MARYLYDTFTVSHKETERMADRISQHDNVRKLFVDATLAWRVKTFGDEVLEAYDLVIAAFTVAESLIEMPTNPAYWSIEDAAMLKQCIRKLHQSAETYHLRKQAEAVT